MGKVLKTSLTLALTPVVALAMVALLFVLIFVFLPYYLLVVVIAKISRPRLGSSITGDAVMLTVELPEQSVGNIAHLIIFDQVIDTDRLCQLFIQRVTERRRDDRAKEFMFSHYRHTWTRFLGLSFWQAEQNFRVEEHVREYDLVGDFYAPPPRTEAEVLGKLGALIARPWEKGKSPWEFLVIQDYRTELEAEKSRTAIYLRHHHALIDGYGIVSLLREFSGCPCAVPALNLKVSPLKKMLCLFRAPYDISKDFLSSVSTCPKSTAWPLPSREIGLLQICVSESMETRAIKTVKNRMGVSFLAVNFALYTRALKRLFKEEGLDIPREIPIVFPLPKRNHPGGTNIHFSLIRMSLPFDTHDPVSHVLETQKALKSFGSTSWPVISNLAVIFTGFLPHLIQAKVVMAYALRGGPNMVSSFPGVLDESVQVDGIQILEVISSFGSTRLSGPAALISGMSGKQRLVLTVNMADWKLKNLHKLGQYVEDELACLLGPELVESLETAV